FGLVKFFQGDNPEGDITNAGTFMGSPHYIAPEQARNQSPDQRCDIYSLAVLMYHMVTGRVPFTAANPVDIILKHLHEPPVPPRPPTLMRGMPPPPPSDVDDSRPRVIPAFSGVTDKPSMLRPSLLVPVMLAAGIGIGIYWFATRPGPQPPPPPQPVAEQKP